MVGGPGGTHIRSADDHDAGNPSDLHNDKSSKLQAPIHEVLSALLLPLPLLSEHNSLGVTCLCLLGVFFLGCMGGPLCTHQRQDY